MRIEYNSMFLKVGNRTPNKLGAPRIFRLSNFHLPKQSIYHYLPATTEDVGPSETNPLFEGVSQRIPLYSFGDIVTRLGNLNVKAFNQNEVLKKHIKQNRRFLPVSHLEQIKPNPLIPVVFNYALVDKKYRYLGDENRIPYYKNANILNTIIKGFVDQYNLGGGYYHNFLFIDVPKIEDLPKVSQMKVSVQMVNLNFFKTFNTLEKLFIFEMWKWLGFNREKSAFKDLPKKVLDKINIVFTSNNLFTVMNLGKLDEWRKSEENKTGVLDPSLMSKSFMKGLVVLNIANKDKDLIELTAEEELQLEKEREDTKGSDDEKEDVFKGEVITNKAKDDSEEDEDDVEEEPVEEVKEENPELKTDLMVVGEVIDEEDSEPIASGKVSELTKSKVVHIPEEQEAEFNDEVFDAKMDVGDVLNLRTLPIEEVPNLIVRQHEPVAPDTKAKAFLDDFAKNQNMTVSKYDGLRKSLGKYRDLHISNEEKRTIAQMIDIKPEEVQIKEEDREISSLQVLDKRYVTEFLERDIASMLVGIQGAGVLVQNVKKQTHENISGGYSVYSMQIKPIEGEPSTLRFKVPVLEPNGRFKVAGSRYFFKKQKRDLPIRKINSDTVSLTSYFGKTFVKREESRAFNYEKWLIAKIRAVAFDKENNKVKETRSGNVFDNKIQAPSLFSMLSCHFRAITTDECFIYFDYPKAKERFGEALVRDVEAKGLFFCGTHKGRLGLGMDEDGVIYSVSGKESTELGVIEDLCGIDVTKAPVEAVTVDIMGKPVPLAIVLGYKLGLTKLLAALKPKYYRTIKTGTRPKLEEHEYTIKFEDFTLILSRKDRMTSLIMSGLNKCADLEKYSILLMDRKEVYFALIESLKIPGRYVKEIELYYNMFVDPITERILLEMREPTDFVGLLVRSVELLLTRYHNDEVDMTGMRVVGNERIAGEIYTQMVNALRVHNRHGVKANYPIEVNPEAAWMSLLKDTSKQMEECLNPIQDLKQQEVTTFGGNGGRSRQSLVKRTRAHHENSIGVISELSVDSSDAGNNTYLSANPKFKSIYGLPDNSGTGEMNKDLAPENIMSTSAMMQPCLDMDDPKRLNFCGVQNSHSLSCSNNRVMPLRTGYDWKLVERSGDMFASIAEQEGKVVSINDYAITVEYKDGTLRHVELGRKYGDAGGFSTAHDTITNLKVGDKLKKGDVIAYCSDFFTPDPMNPGKLAMKTGILAKVALIEHPFTFEDSTAITKRLSGETRVKTVVKKEVVVNFEQSIHRIAKPGTVLKIDDPLCFIEDSLTHDTGLFDETSIDLLRNISQQAPRSPVNGVVDKIEILYNGDKEDMSESLQKLANQSDNKLLALQKALGKKGFTGEVDDSYRVDGNPLLLDTAVIIFTISGEQAISIGDKVVISAQLKSTIGHVFDEPPRIATEDGEMGEEIDCLFGSNSVYNRIVTSPFLIGITNTLLTEMSKRIGTEYLESKK